MTQAPQPWEIASPANPYWPTTQHAFTWPFADTCGAECPYCHSLVGMRRLAEAGHRWWTDDEAVTAWRNVAERYGPCYVNFSGLEPGEQLGLVSRVIRFHYGSMTTNLAFDLDEFSRLMTADRLRLHPTFHPHLWSHRIEPFLDRVERLQAEGYDIPFVSLVAYPPYLERLAEYVSAIERVVAFANVAPLRNASYRGKPYPESYTPSELKLLMPDVGESYDERGRIPPPDVSRCAAGHAGACISLNGDVRRCIQVGGMGDQNLFRDGNLSFLPEPAACNEETCRCLQLHIYHVRD